MIYMSIFIFVRVLYISEESIALRGSDALFHVIEDRRLLVRVMKRGHQRLL